MTVTVWRLAARREIPRSGWDHGGWRRAGCAAIGPLATQSTAETGGTRNVGEMRGARRTPRSGALPHDIRGETQPWSRSRSIDLRVVVFDNFTLYQRCRATFLAVFVGLVALGVGRAEPPIGEATRTDRDNRARRSVCGLCVLGLYILH